MIQKSYILKNYRHLWGKKKKRVRKYWLTENVLKTLNITLAPNTIDYAIYLRNV